MPYASSFGLHLLVVRKSVPWSRIAGSAASAICATSTTTTPRHATAITSVRRRNAQSLPYSNAVGGRQQDSLFSLMGRSVGLDVVDRQPRFGQRLLRQWDVAE